MRLSVTPSRLVATPGAAQTVEVTVTNTGTLIGGYAVRVLGLDPSWVEIGDDDIALFPGEERVLTAVVTVPAGMVAGERRAAVQVRETTEPHHSDVAPLVLVVPEARDLRVAVDPVALTVGRAGTFSLLVDNTGNTPLRGRLVADDPENKLRFTTSPAHLDVAPGEHAVVDLRAVGRRPLTGAPLVRLISLRLDESPDAAAHAAHLNAPAITPAVTPAVPPAATPAAAPAPAEPRAPGSHRIAPRRRAKPVVAAPPDTPALAHATLIQKPLLSRGAFSLVGLLVAVTVFAVVITVALTTLVDRSAKDRDLALKIAAAQDGSGDGGPASGLRGVVRELSTGATIEGVSVTVFSADDVTTALRSLSTDKDGAYAVGGLPAGDYKISYRGADFVQQWYPNALEPDNADTVTLEDNNLVAGLDVALGGVPASISGTVLGSDVSGASVTLRARSSAAGLGAVGATVQTAPVGAGGEFVLADLPSPALYDLVVTKEGYAESVQPVDVGAGEVRRGVELNLVKGNGEISGRVVADGRGAPDVVLTATAGSTTVTTRTLSKGAQAGTFTLDQLPTPAAYTIVASGPDLAPQTVLVSLGDAQRVEGLSITLTTSAGGLAGSVVGQDNLPLGGVTVRVSDGATTVQTATRSQVDPQDAPAGQAEVGSWSVAGLTLPGTYTVTFSRDDLVTQTVSVALDASGVVIDGANPLLRPVVMRPSTASIEGRVTQTVENSKICPDIRSGDIGEVTVTLSSGTNSYTVTTASVPTTSRGRYRIDGIVPGTYTLSFARPGVSPTSTIVTLAAGQTLSTDKDGVNPKLRSPASVSGTVLGARSRDPKSGYTVELFRSDSFPGESYRASVRTNSEGKYEFCDIDAPESYVVQARETANGPPVGTKAFRRNPSQFEPDEDITVREPQ